MSEDVTSENFPAERFYERWVMRVAELVHGIYPEEMQVALEDVREVSDHLDVLEEIRDAQAALQDLWMALGGIAATEDPASTNENGNT